MSASDPLISAIIVSYNTRELTLKCLRALYSDLEGAAAEVFVVDNASSDGSVEAIRGEFAGVRVIANQKNAGFGAANNQAMKLVRGQYFLLLNTDAFVQKGTARALVDYLDRNPKVAAVGPRLVYGDGSLQKSCYRFPGPLRSWIESLGLPKVFPHTHRLGDYRRWAHDRERPVDWVIGACLLVRREAYEQVGGFDERFFMYAEETDWQRSMRDAGWEIGFTPAATVMHLAGSSGAADKPKINRHFFEAFDRYVMKRYGWPGLIVARMGLELGIVVRLPFWVAMLAAVKRRREYSKARLKLLSWLLVRHATLWRVQKVASA